MGYLIEKLSDSKQVVREATMVACAALIENSRPALFAQHTLKSLSHASWHVREGVLSLLVRCLLMQGRVNSSNRLDPEAGVVSLALNL